MVFLYIEMASGGGIDTVMANPLYNISGITPVHHLDDKEEGSSVVAKLERLLVRDIGSKRNSLNPSVSSP